MKKLFLIQRDAALIEKVNQDVRDLFEPDMLSSGYDSFLDEAVYDLDVDDQWNIEAEVEGNKYLYEVQLNLHDLQDAECNCQHDDYCEHMAAVLFAVYKRFGLRASLLLNGNQTLMSSGVPAMQGSGGKRPPELTPAETHIAEEWHRFFERKMGTRFIPALHELEGMERYVKKTLLPFAQTWQPVNRSFYAIHVELYIVKILEKSFRQAESYYYFRHDGSYDKLADQSLQRILIAVKELQSEAVRTSHAEHFQSTIDYLAQHTFQEESPLFNWLDLYRMLWWSTFHHDSWIAAETKRLTELLTRTSAGLRREFLVSALAHFDVMAGRDQQAMEMIAEKLPHVHPDLYLLYPILFHTAKNTDRLLSWLRWLRPYVSDKSFEHWEGYLDVWENASHSATAGEFEQVIRELLPRSLPYYSQYLLKREAYREWVELQFLCDVDPVYVEPSQLRRVADKAPEVLLPYFHQAVELCIAQKNRDAYAWAVKLLTSLRRYYRKLRRDDDWSRFIRHLTSRYSRLRALQEEIKKGKLLL